MPSDFRDNLEHILAAAPVLKAYPNQATALAQIPDVTTDEVQSVGANQQGQQYRNWLEGLPGDRRTEEWNRLTNEQRSLAATAGFNPVAPGVEAPGPQQQEHGGFSGFLDKVGNAAGSAWGGVKHGAGTALDWAGKPLEEVKHGERMLMDYEQGHGGIAQGWLKTFSPVPGLGIATEVLMHPTEMARAWRNTQDGDRSYNQAALNQVRNTYAPDTFDLAKRVAEGETQESILNSAGDNQQLLDAYTNMFHSQSFQEAVNAVNNSKLSIGRVLARELGADVVADQGKFKWASGTIDAANSWFADPTLVGGKVVKAVRASKYGITALSAKRIDEIFDAKTVVAANKPVVRYWNGALQHINAIAAAEDAPKVGAAFEQLQTNYRQALPLVDSLVDYARTEKGSAALQVEDVKNFFQGAKGMEHLMLGQAAYRGPLMPYKGLIAEKVGDRVRNGVRRRGIGFLEKPSTLMDQALTGGLDELEKAGAATAQGALLAQLREQSRRYRTGMLASRFLEQSPAGKKGRLDLHGPEAAKTVYNLARSYLPRWHANQVAGAFAAADNAGRMLVYKGLLHSLGEAAGITRDERGRDWLKGFVDSVDQGAAEGKRAYSGVHGNDVFEPGRSDAIWEHQFTQDVPLPSFKDLHEMASRVGIMSSLGHAVTMPMLDRLMGLWRPGVLIRPAMAFRNALEENTDHIVTHGVWDFTKGGYARYLLDSKAREMAKRGLVADIGSRMEGARGLPLSEDIQRYLDDIDEDGLQRYVESMWDTNTRALNNREQVESATSGWFDRRGPKQERLGFRQTGDFNLKEIDGDNVRRWTVQLEKLSGERAARAMLPHLEDHDSAVAAAAEYYLSDAFRKTHSRAWRTLVRDSPDDPATQMAAARTLAERAYTDLRHHLSDRDGNLIDDLVNDIRVQRADGTYAFNRDAINTRRLRQVPEESRPAHVVAGDTVLIQNADSTGLQWAIEKGYEQTGKLTAKLGRSNIYWANYLKAREASEPWQRQLAADYFEHHANRLGLDLGDADAVAKVRARADQAAAEHVTAQAQRTAEMQTLSYVDNPDVRSQASVVLRNVIPFYRAQEEFYRRWARTFRHNPEALRKLQMVNEGAHGSGMVEKDEQGNDIFIYPASGFTQQLMYDVGKKLGWNWAMSPVPSQITSQVRFLNQGLDPKNILPSFGPLAAMPLKAVEAIFPESTAIKAANRRVLGDQGANSGVIGGLVPTFARRVYESGIFGNDSAQLASAMKQSMVYLEVAGRTPPEGASDAAVEDYTDDVRKWARVHLFMKAIFGTSAPAAPQELGAPNDAPIGDHIPDDPGVFMSQHKLIDQFRRQNLPTVASEFRAEVARLHGDYATALANWIRTRPEQLPFTVGTTEAQFGGFIPATAEAGKFFDKNRGLFHSFPAAAVLFMPQGSGDFDMDVYRSQLGAGLREKKDMKQFALDLKLAGNLQDYYDHKDAYLAQAAQARAAGDTAGARAAEDQWTAASQQFKQMHPAVGTYLNNYQDRQNDRTRVMAELQSMVQNNAMPNIPGAPAIALMVDAYQKRQSALDQIGGDRTAAATAQKRAVKDGFQAYVKQLAATDLNADMVYQRLLRSLGDE